MGVLIFILHYFLVQALKCGMCLNLFNSILLRGGWVVVSDIYIYDLAYLSDFRGGISGILGTVETVSVMSSAI
jgi:hypothetical protein